MSMAETAPHLEPNADDMARHLEFLFCNAREYDDGLIEIAAGMNGSWHSRLFNIDQINEAVQYAAQENARGANVYTGQALRDPDTPPFGRASDADHYATTAAYVDLDTSEAAAAAAERTAAMRPHLAVCTGVHPHRRMQLHWTLDEPVTSHETHRAICEGLADSLGGDRSVCNPSRILRLAGSIAWPTKPGRIAEMTFLMRLKGDTPPPVTPEQLQRQYPRASNAHTIDTGKNQPIERNGAGILGLGTEQVTDGRHTYMRDTILAVFGELVGTTGAAPSPQELYETAWPQYEAHVDLSRPGRGADVFARMCASTLRRFEQGRLRGRGGKTLTLEGIISDWQERGAPQAKTPADYTAHINWIEEAADRQKAQAEKPEDRPIKKIQASPFRLVPEGQIPPRDWVYGRHLIRRFVSATVAPGGVGKSSLTFVEAMAMVTGKALLNVPVPKPLKVWVWCLEDPREELDRRFAAIAKHYKLTDDDIGGRLFLNSGRDTPLCVARQETKTGAIIVEPDMAEIEAEITSFGVDVLLVDPFVASHQVSENDNVAINAVMRQWVLLAERCNVAIELIHHTRKNGDGEVTVETSRGAKALTDATRDTRVINQMSEGEAAKFGIENRRLHFRTYSDKANLAPPAERSDWYMLENVTLANGALGADGDHVGVAARWEVPGPFDKVSKETVNSILTAINLGVIDADGNQTGIPYGESNRGRSKRWVGQVIIDHTGMEEEEAKRAITAWLQTGVLVTEEVEIHRKPATGIRVDRAKWAEIMERQQ